MAPSTGLLDLPTEILQYILLILTTPSYQQTALACKGLFELASTSRAVVLHHLHAVPGIKTNLDDPKVSTQDLFLLFRQRASKHLFGANFTADCLELRPRNARLDVDASSLSTLDKDYVTMSIVFKDTLTVRLYSTGCDLKERIVSPFCGGKAKILQVVHKTSIAVLYQWEPEAKKRSPAWLEKPLVKEHVYKKPNNLTISSPSNSDDEDTSDEDEEPPTVEAGKKFHLQIHESTDRPTTYTIEQHKKLVPRHLAYSSRLLWAILWDVEGSIMPTAECEIVQYTAPRRLVPMEEASYDSRVVWPNEFDPAPVLSSSDIAKGVARKLPKRIAFFKEGRRLSLYAAGDIVPFKVLGVGSIRESRSPINSVHFENLTLFYVDKSFYGSHDPYYDLIEARQLCTLTHLCLGVSEIIHPTRKYKILCILRSKSKLDHDDCPHVVNIDRMNHVSAENCKAVARLWGWSPQSSTLTGLDTVAISAHGTRIAIAQWNRVLVWSLDPKMLCQDIVDFDGEDETKKSKRKNKTKLDGSADNFYQRTKDPQMGWKIADLKPIVIDLNGAVARKMAWSIQHDKYGSESEDESDEEGSNVEGSNSGTSVVASELPTENQGSDAMVGVVMSGEADAKSEVQMTPISESLVPASNHNNETNLGSSGHLENNLTQSKVEMKDQTPQKTPNADSEDGVATKSVSDRNLPMVGSPRRQQQLGLDKSPTSLNIVDHGVKTEASEILQGTTIDARPTNAMQAEPDAMAIDLMPSSSDKSCTEPKGKEKESDTVMAGSSTEIIKSPTFPPIQPRIKKTVRRKRFTEDHLVIMTDRGFQMWDFGVHSRRQRVTKWLEEQ